MIDNFEQQKQQHKKEETMGMRVDTIRFLYYYIFYFFVRRLRLCLISSFLSHCSSLVEASARFKLKVADRKVLPLRFPVDLTVCPPFRQPSLPSPLAHHLQQVWQLSFPALTRSNKLRQSSLPFSSPGTSSFLFLLNRRWTRFAA